MKALVGAFNQEIEKLQTSRRFVLSSTGQSPDDVLGRELEQVVVHVVDLGVARHGGGGGEGPAAAAHALVPHLRDHALGAPVHLGREVLQPRRGLAPHSEVSAGQAPGVKTTTGVTSYKFLPEQYQYYLIPI